MWGAAPDRFLQRSTARFWSAIVVADFRGARTGRLWKDTTSITGPTEETSGTDAANQKADTDQDVSAEASPDASQVMRPTSVDGLLLIAESFLARGPTAREGNETSSLFI